MTILSLQAPRRQAGGRILAIEADEHRARALRQLLLRRHGLDVIFVSSVDQATQSIGERVPDLVLTSAFLQPHEADALTTFLKETPGASHVQVLIAPGLIDAMDAPTTHARRGFRVRRRRAAAPPTTCNVAAVLEQIDAYLEQARALTTGAPGIAVSAGVDAVERNPQIRLVHTRGREHADAVSDILRRVDQLAGPRGRDRRRAARRPGAELPWLWSAKLPSGIDLKVVDVSNGGVLVETQTKLPLGATIELRIVGHETNLSVLARIARTEVAHVDARGVKYHIGAAFARDLDLMRPEGLSPEMMPGVLADVLSRVLAQTDRGSTAALLCFEQELARLLPVRSVQVRHEPAAPTRDTESVYFSIPGGAGSILQATFETDCAPSPLEFKLLKAAVNLAAVVLEFAPPRTEDHRGVAARA